MILSMHSRCALEQSWKLIDCQTHPSDKTLDEGLQNGNINGVDTFSSAHFASTANIEDAAVIVVKLSRMRLANFVA